MSEPTTCPDYMDEPEEDDTCPHGIGFDEECEDCEEEEPS